MLKGLQGKFNLPETLINPVESITSLSNYEVLYIGVSENLPFNPILNCKTKQ